jgi:hypothetical protein
LDARRDRGEETAGRPRTRDQGKARARIWLRGGLLKRLEREKRPPVDIVRILLHRGNGGLTDFQPFRHLHLGEAKRLARRFHGVFGAHRRTCEAENNIGQPINIT